jgi:hypothetical protein
MEMKRDNQQILEGRVKRGQEAQRAMDVYLAEFFKERELTIYTEFVNSPFDEAKLTELKRCQMALVDLKGTVLSDIAMGKSAEENLKTLSE